MKTQSISGDIEPLVKSEIERLAIFDPTKWLRGETLETVISSTLYQLETRMRTSGALKDINQTSGENRIELLGYNVPWWVQGILEETTMLPVVDKPTQMLYPYDPNTVIPLTRYKIVDKAGSYISKVLIYRYFIKNYSNLRSVFLTWWQENRGQLNGKNIFIPTNHITRINLGIIALCFHEFLGIPRKDIYIVVGPKVMTHDFTRAATGQANIVKVFPGGQNGAVPAVEKLRGRSAKQILKIISQKGDENPKVMIMAVSGGTDKLLPDGTYEMALPSEALQGLVNLIVPEKALLSMMPVDDSEIFRGNKKLTRGHVGINPVPLSENPNFTGLPNLIRDHQGRQLVGMWNNR